MSKVRPTVAKTRRGNRIYRNRSVNKGQEHFADSYTFAIKKDGQRHRLNLGTDLEAAKKMADQISAFLSIPSNTIADLFLHPDFSRLKKPRKFRNTSKSRENKLPVAKHVPTVKELLNRYQANAVHLSPTTVENNCNALRHIAAKALGLRPVSKSATKDQRRRWREKVGQVAINEFTLLQLEELRVQALKKAGTDGIKRGKTATTLNTYFRSCRSIFAERMTAFYEDFELPEPLPFRQIRPIREPARRYISRVDLEEIISKAKQRFWDRRIDADRTQNKEDPIGHRSKKQADMEREDKARFIVLLLTVSCGLRPKEIAKLTWEQVDFENLRIHVAVTSYDTPKAKNSESWIDVSQAVLGVLNEFKQYSIYPPFVIPAFRRRNEEPRKPGIEIFKGLYRWLRQNGVNEEWPLYVFRKEAGSIIYQQTDSFDAAADFLRNDPRVAREHYVGRKKRLEVSVPGLD